MKNTDHREVWIALRSDKKVGSGTQTNPYSGNTPERLNTLFAKFEKENQDNLVIHFGPGVYHGTRTWRPGRNWKIRGAGMDITILRTKPDANAIDTVGFLDYYEHAMGFELSDMTIDFNTPNLHKSNRVFIVPTSHMPRISYYYLDPTKTEEWSKDIEYPTGHVVRYNGLDYICYAWRSKGDSPVQGQSWNVLRSNQPGELPVWTADKTYVQGDTVKKDRLGYICAVTETTADPVQNKIDWYPVDPKAPDHRISAHAAFIVSKRGEGRNRVERVKVLNGFGNFFTNREGFLIGLGGDDCVIQDCYVDQMLGDYSTMLVLFRGHGSAIRGCSVRGTGSRNSMGYGGWECSDCVFENNFGYNLNLATNIDSLTNRNVTFCNNKFMQCLSAGIAFHSDGGDNWNVEPRQPNTIDGIFIYNNLIEISDTLPGFAIRVSGDGVSNVQIRNNIMRTISGKGNDRVALRLAGKMKNVYIENNTCDPGMCTEISSPDVMGYGNMDFAGNPIAGLEKLVKPVARK